MLSCSPNKTHLPSPPITLLLFFKNISMDLFPWEDCPTPDPSLLYLCPGLPQHFPLPFIRALSTLYYKQFPDTSVPCQHQGKCLTC